ncbi:MAG: Holliday junction resolvase RuvX [Firmicutes bacterium]|nr:Holliday junction resolvase RuvX [Bacillota bacterium]
MKRIMGLDVGEKRMGVAISDPMGWTAQGVDMVRCDQPDWLKRLQELIEQYEVDKLVVGLPRNMDGSIGEKGQICQELSRQLEERFSIPVELWDERLSTIAVERTLIDADMSRRKRRKVIDQMAASWILQGYLDAQRRNRDV